MCTQMRLILMEDSVFALSTFLSIFLSSFLPLCLSPQVLVSLAGLSFSGVPTLHFSMVSDIADLEQLRTGGQVSDERRSYLLVCCVGVSVGAYVGPWLSGQLIVQPSVA